MDEHNQKFMTNVPNNETNVDMLRALWKEIGIMYCGREQAHLNCLMEEFGGSSDEESFLDSLTENEEEIHELYETVVEGKEEEIQELYEASEEDSVEPDGDSKMYYFDRNMSKWSKIPAYRNVRTHSENIIIDLPGVKGMAKEKNTPLDCWLLFITEDMLDNIVSATNIKLTSEAIGYEANDQYLVKQTEKKEIKAVLGLLYLAGLYKSNRQNLSDLWNSDDIELFRSVMSMQRFLILLQSLRFDIAESRAHRLQFDKLAPIRTIFDSFVDNCKAHYSPNEYLTIAEKLESFRGRVSFRQHMPNKPANYGLKVFALVDAKSLYCANMELCVGMQPEGLFQQSNNPQDIVERLITQVSGTKRNITFDKWFTSYPLMINLLKTHNLTSVGTVRKNKREIPSALLNTRAREPCSSLFAFKEEITAVSYVPKKSKNVILFSTLHHFDIIGATDEKLPKMIEFYNVTKGGVDTLNEINAHLSVLRDSRRWPLTLFFLFLNTAGVNSEVVYKTNTNKFGMKSTFLKELGIQLISDFRNDRRQNTCIPRGLREIRIAEYGEPATKRRKNSTRNTDRKTFYGCMTCGAALCTDHEIFT